MSATKLGHDNRPTCNSILNRATAINGDYVPMPGDLSICIKCGEYLQYASDMKLIVFPEILFMDLPYKQRNQLAFMRKHIRINNTLCKN